MRTITLPNNFRIECESERTRYGFRHLAVLKRGDAELERTKACYYNRTWERYTFESVIHSLLRRSFDGSILAQYMQIADEQGLDADMSGLRTTGMMASLGNLLSETQSDKNKWKQRMIRAGLPELDFPDDWDTLPEDVKEKRLDQMIAMMKEVK